MKLGRRMFHYKESVGRLAQAGSSVGRPKPTGSRQEVTVSNKEKEQAWHSLLISTGREGII